MESKLNFTVLSDRDDFVDWLHEKLILANYQHLRGVLDQAAQHFNTERRFSAVSNAAINNKQPREPQLVMFCYKDEKIHSILLPKTEARNIPPEFGPQDGMLFFNILPTGGGRVNVEADYSGEAQKPFWNILLTIAKTYEEATVKIVDYLESVLPKDESEQDHTPAEQRQTVKPVEKRRKTLSEIVDLEKRARAGDEGARHELDSIAQDEGYKDWESQKKALKPLEEEITAALERATAAMEVRRKKIETTPYVNVFYKRLETLAESDNPIDRAIANSIPVAPFSHLERAAKNLERELLVEAKRTRNADLNTIQATQKSTIYGLSGGGHFDSSTIRLNHTAGSVQPGYIAQNADEANWIQAHNAIYELPGNPAQVGKGGSVQNSTTLPGLSKPMQNGDNLPADITSAEIDQLQFDVIEFKKLYRDFTAARAIEILKAIPAAWEKYESESFPGQWGPMRIGQKAICPAATVSNYLRVFHLKGLRTLDGIEIPHRTRRNPTR